MACFIQIFELIVRKIAEKQSKKLFIIIVLFLALYAPALTVKTGGHLTITDTSQLWGPNVQDMSDVLDNMLQYHV